MVTHIKVECSQGVSELPVPSTILAVPDFITWLNGLSIGTFSATQVGLTDEWDIVQTAICKIWFRVGGVYIRCNTNTPCTTIFNMDANSNLKNNGTTNDFYMNIANPIHYASIVTSIQAGIGVMRITCASGVIVCFDLSNVSNLVQASPSEITFSANPATPLPDACVISSHNMATPFAGEATTNIEIPC